MSRTAAQICDEVYRAAQDAGVQLPAGFTDWLNDLTRPRVKMCPEWFGIVRDDIGAPKDQRRLYIYGLPVDLAHDLAGDKLEVVRKGVDTYGVARTTTT